MQIFRLFYIKASPYQKWTFLNVQNPKKLVKYIINKINH